MENMLLLLAIRQCAVLFVMVTNLACTLFYPDELCLVFGCVPFKFPLQLTPLNIEGT